MGKIKIVQKKQKGRGDSLFYEGEIACAESNGWLFSLIAAGDICVTVDGERYGTCHCEHHLEDLFEGKFRLTDRKLQNWMDSGRLSWDMNNWFEVLFREKGEDSWDCDACVVAGNYDDAIQLLKDYINEDRFKR